MTAQTSSNHWWLLQTQHKEWKGDLVTFTEEILDGKLHFLCSEIALTVITDYARFLKLLQITFKNIANYGRYCKLRHYYKLRRNRVIFWSDATEK